MITLQYPRHKIYILEMYIYIIVDFFSQLDVDCNFAPGQIFYLKKICRKILKIEYSIQIVSDKRVGSTSGSPKI